MAMDGHYLHGKTINATIWGCRYAIRSTGPKITKLHRENTTEDDGSHV